MRRLPLTIVTTAVLAGFACAVLPADRAAAAPNPTVTACFKHADNGSAYHESVFFQEWTGSSWNTLGTQDADINGCASFYSNPNRTVKLYAYERVGRAEFTGNTGAHDVGTTDIGLGTYPVYQHGSN